MKTEKHVIYDTEKYYQRSLDRFLRARDVPKRTKKLVVDFLNYAEAKGLSRHRTDIYLSKLKVLARHTKKPLDKRFTKKDMEALFAKIQRMRYSSKTIEMFKTIIKTYYRWLYDLDPGDPLPKSVKWLRGKTIPTKVKKEDLLSEKEVVKMMDACESIRDKVMLSLLYETGMRPGELLNMKIKDIHIGPNHITITVRGKTEHIMGERKVYVFRSYDLLMKWLESHPKKNDPDYPVWIYMCHIKKSGKDLFGQVLHHSAFYRVIQRARKKSGIKRKVKPYLFRHSAAQRFYKELGEANAKILLGHAQDSRMAKVYNHMNDEDALEALMQNMGLAKPKEKKALLKCQRCKIPLGYTDEVCPKCGAPANVRGVVEIEKRDVQSKKVLDLIEVIEDLPEVRALLEDRRIQEKIAEKMAENLIRNKTEG